MLNEAGSKSATMGDLGIPSIQSMTNDVASLPGGTPLLTKSNLRESDIENITRNAAGPRVDTNKTTRQVIDNAAVTLNEPRKALNATYSKALDANTLKEASAAKLYNDFMAKAANTNKTAEAEAYQQAAQALLKPVQF
jgi:hypothetical protein